jgi:hypothetical protein
MGLMVMTAYMKSTEGATATTNVSNSGSSSCSPAGPGGNSVTQTDNGNSSNSSVSESFGDFISFASKSGLGCKDGDGVLTRLAPNNDTQIQVIEWNMMDKSKFYPLSMLSSFTIRTLMYPMTLVKTKIQVGFMAVEELVFTKLLVDLITFVGFGLVTDSREDQRLLRNNRLLQESYQF